MLPARCSLFSWGGSHRASGEGSVPFLTSDRFPNSHLRQPRPCQWGQQRAPPLTALIRFFPAAVSIPFSSKEAKTRRLSVQIAVLRVWNVVGILRNLLPPLCDGWSRAGAGSVVFGFLAPKFTIPFLLWLFYRFSFSFSLGFFSLIGFYYFIWLKNYAFLCTGEDIL